MNPIEQLINSFQNLAVQVPEFIQPFIIMLAGAIPFVDGAGAAVIGVVAGLNPVVAAIAAAAGNFLSVLLVVLLFSRARTAVSNRNLAQTAVISGTTGTMITVEDAPAKAVSKGRVRFNMWLDRYGVPGASVLGPLAIPAQITSSILLAGGTPRTRVLLWQAVGIVLWTVISTISVWLAFKVAGLI